MRVRAHVRCQCTHFEADWCRDGRERDDLVIRCRCGPGGCISGRRGKSTRASSNPVSKCASDHALTSWTALRFHLGRPLLVLACAAQPVSPGRLEGLLCGFCSPPHAAATARRTGYTRAMPPSRSARNASCSASARGRCAAAAHGRPIAVAHAVSCCAACLCLLSHRSGMFLQRGQLEHPHQPLSCSCHLAPRAPMQHAPFRLACSLSRCALQHLLAPVPLLVLADTSPTLLSALGDPLRLEPAQQRPPWRMHMRHACVLCRTLSPAALLLRLFPFRRVLTVQHRLARLHYAVLRACPALLLPPGWTYEACPLCRDAPEQS